VTRIVLGSASPRRRELLAAAGAEFEVDKPDVDEALPSGIEPVAAALLLAERKARAIAARHSGRDVVVLAADTIVAVDRPEGMTLLGKAEDADEAARMLGWLSGSRHQVVTGVCALSARGGAPQVGHERTWVTMRALSPAEIVAYVTSGEWRDKAGAYAIQETADRFVTRLEEGGFDNVVGLPVRLALELVERAALAGEPRPGYPLPPSSRGPRP
jgi:septum formation protein